jgi:hypothetical protein
MDKYHASDRFVAVGEEEILYIISNIFAKPQVFYYLVSDAKIFDIIYLLSPLLECDPTVCLPYRGSQSYWWRKLKGSNYNWKHVRLTWEFPWDFLASGGPYYETLRLAVDPTNG